MSIVWTILGAILIVLVVTMCVVFFVVRPMLARRIGSASTVLARELNGQQPVLSAPASCEGTTDPAKANLKGLGALALTQDGLVFVAAKTDEVLIVPLANVTQAAPATSVELLGRTVRRARSMLVVSWQLPGDQTPRTVAFTVDDANRWLSALPISPGSGT